MKYPPIIKSVRIDYGDKDYLYAEVFIVTQDISPLEIDKYLNNIREKFYAAYSSICSYTYLQVLFDFEYN